MSSPPPQNSPSNEAEETIDAIHQGRVDAIVVQGPAGPRVILLDDGAEPYRILVERMSDGALTFDANGTILFTNGRLAELTGCTRDDLVGRNFPSLFAGVAPADAHNSAVDAELVSSEKTIPVSVWTTAITIGGLTATLATITDLSIHRHAEEIADAERFARSILEQATDAIVVLAPSGDIINASWMAEEIAGQPLVGRRFSETFLLDRQGVGPQNMLSRLAPESLDKLLATKPFHGVEVKLSNSKVAKRSYLLSAGPLVNDAKEPVGSIVTLIDITDRKSAEEQQNVLVAELNHRVKNILAIVQSVAAQTARRSSSLGAFTSTFSGRVKALAVAHDILTQTRWIGIGLNELLQAVLAPYRYPDENRVMLSGSPVMVPARMVLPLSMAVHELATNASKYGSLSNPQGVVHIEWGIGDAEPQLLMSWREQGGPAVTVADSGGFGTTLIRRVIEYDLKGKVDLRFPPEGMHGRLTFPLRDGGLSAEPVGEAISAAGD